MILRLDNLFKDQTSDWDYSDYGSVFLIGGGALVYYVLVAMVFSNALLAPIGTNCPAGAGAEVVFSQEVDSFDFDGDDEYSVNVSVSSFERTDYLVVRKAGSSDGVSYESDVRVSPRELDFVPDSVSETQSVSVEGNGVILTGKGDTARVSGLEAGDTVQVFAGLDGRERLINSYEVEDTY